MQGLPDRAGLDLIIGQPEAHILARGAKKSRIDRDHRQPTCGGSPGGLGHERQSGFAREARRVGGEIPSASRDPLIEHLQLAPANSGQDVAEPVVVSHRPVFVVGHIFSCLGRQEAGASDQRVVVRDEHPPTRRGDDLVAVEGKNAEKAAASRKALAVPRAQGFGRILDQRHLMPSAGGDDRIQIRALTEKVDQDDGAYPSALRSGAIEFLGQQDRIHVPATGL